MKESIGGRVEQGIGILWMRKFDVTKSFAFHYSSLLYLKRRGSGIGWMNGFHRLLQGQASDSNSYLNGL